MSDELLEIASDLESIAKRLRAVASGTNGSPDEDWPAWREAQASRRRLRDPRWPPRGQLAHLVRVRGGRVKRLEWVKLAVACGYSDGRSINGFYSGRPPMFRDESG